MIPKRSRVTARAIQAILKEGKTYTTPHLTLRFSPDEETTVGFVVPRTLNLSAAERNKLRRRGYATARPLVHTISPHTILFFFKKGAQHLSPTELQDEIKTLLDKLSVPGYNTH